MNDARVVGILGTGLIGGSIGLRARRSGARVIGYDDDPAALAGALEAGAIDAEAARDELYAAADVVAIAAHLDATLAELDRLRAATPCRSTLVVDVASVKTPVCAAAAGLQNFVATHPMAGSARSGARAASADLFEGRVWAFVPSGDFQLDARAREFIASHGARPVAVNAVEHDRIVAYTSHVPQLLAWSYAAQAPPSEGETLDALKGATARELFRLAESNFTMWREILRANDANVEPALRRLGHSLLDVADHLKSGDLEALANR